MNDAREGAFIDGIHKNVSDAIVPTDARYAIRDNDDAPRVRQCE